jgi:predicted HD superfamily hydrolase involved in NAD metabolism
MGQLSFKRYLPFLERVLTPKRLEHSLGVMQVMGELAPVYAIDRDKALTTGLLHDAAKDLTPTRQTEIISQARIEIHHACDSNYLYYLHGPVGAYFVQRELGVSDPLILDAIATHTYYGNTDTFDSPICWCLRFADILEPARNWSRVRWLSNGVSRLREAVYAGHMAEGALLQTGWLIKWFGEENVPIHPNMERVYRELSATLNVDDSFLEAAAR